MLQVMLNFFCFKAYKYMLELLPANRLKRAYFFKKALINSINLHGRQPEWQE